MQKSLFAPVMASLLLAFAGTATQAQGVYRIVGPDGKVTFSDRPPPEAKAVTAPAPSARPAAAAQANPGNSATHTLPYELRQVATRFPVTLYTGSDCAPCNSARNLLTARGIPFTERTVTSNEDITALQRLSGSSSLPFGTIGGQQLTGFADGEWTQYLNAAGYPPQSQLPNNYKAPAATPLVAIKAAEPVPRAAQAPTASPIAAPVAPPPLQDGPTPSNPAGIRF